MHVVPLRVAHFESGLRHRWLTYLIVKAAGVRHLGTGTGECGSEQLEGKSFLCLNKLQKAEYAPLQSYSIALYNMVNKTTTLGGAASNLVIGKTGVSSSFNLSRCLPRSEQIHSL
jgi:hypothetical protein